MDSATVDCFVGQHVYMAIEYSKNLSGVMLVKEGGWLLRNKNGSYYSLAFITQLGDLDFLPTFEAEEILSIEMLTPEEIDINCVGPEWRTGLDGQKKEQQCEQGMTPKGPYQTSGMNWL